MLTISLPRSTPRLPKSMNRAAASGVFTPAARQALRAFPIEAGEIELVSLSENVTFQVTDRSGATYALRLHRPGYHTLDALKSERLWTRALANAGIDVPVPLMTRDGRDYVSVFVHEADQHRYAGMTRWIPGELLENVLMRAGSVDVFECWFERLGAISAAMHVQSSAWCPPPMFERHALDTDGLMGETPFWGAFWEHPGLSITERRLLLDTRERIRAALDHYGRNPSTYGVIHADLHPRNLLVDGDRLTVIDFDDTAFGWYLYDLAAALLHYQSRSDFAVIEDACIGGYRARREISDDALALIGMFRLVRGMAAIGWQHQRPEIDRGERFKEMKDMVCAQCAAFGELC
jgi:Ser/Thr protein kinase RdoA (MazF antagonist)